MTSQEIFDKVSKHLLTQNSKSYLDTTTEDGVFKCAYRGEGGKQCAIGCLIPDNLYDKIFEDQTICSLLPIYQNLRECLIPEEYIMNKSTSLFDHSGYLFLHMLQFIHDQYDTENWEFQLKEFAKRWSLQIKPEIFGGNE